MHKGLLIDFTRCIGCGACMDGCREANGLRQPEPGESPPTKLNSDNYTVVLEKETPQGTPIYVRQLCMHCHEPTCVSVCPVAALEKREDGPVLYDGDRCMGCRYCMMACPFTIPTYTWGSLAPVIRKCVLCYHRLDEGQEPACAASCPTGATRFGTREVLLRLARERIASHPDLYIDHIYGEHEAGGTDVLMISSAEFSSLGFRTDIPNTPMPELTWTAQEKIPNVAFTAGVFLSGIYWLVHRRMELAKHGETEGE